MSRAEESPARMAKLPRFYFYVDEFQSMMNEAFADILSESRKYKLALTLANQYIEQMDEKVREAVFGNVGTLIVFRVGPFDAEVLKTVFEPTFMAEDLVELGLGQIYLTLMIDGVGSSPFSAETIPPIERPAISYRDDVLEHSRATYGRSRADIERSVVVRQQEYASPPKKEKDRDKKRGPGGFSSNYSSAQRQSAPQAPKPPEGDRTSLRAAIQAAQPVPSSLTRSPIEILREKQAARVARQATQAVNQSPSPAPVRAAAPAAAASQKADSAVSSTDEISPEMLRSVIGSDGPLDG